MKFFTATSFREQYILVFEKCKERKSRAALPVQRDFIHPQLQCCGEPRKGFEPLIAEIKIPAPSQLGYRGIHARLACLLLELLIIRRSFLKESSHGLHNTFRSDTKRKDKLNTPFNQKDACLSKK